jgi:hypothetical protein
VAALSYPLLVSEAFVRNVTVTTDYPPFQAWGYDEYKDVGLKELLARVKAVFFAAFHLVAATVFMPIDLARLNFHFITTRPFRSGAMARVNYAALKCIVIGQVCLLGSILSPRTMCLYINSARIQKEALVTLITSLPANLNDIAQANGVPLGRFDRAPERLVDWRAKFSETLLETNITQANAMWGGPQRFDAINLQVLRYPLYQLLRERYPALVAGNRGAAVVYDFFEQPPERNLPEQNHVDFFPCLGNIFPSRIAAARDFQVYDIVFRALEAARDDLLQHGWTRDDLEAFVGDAYTALLSTTLFKLAMSSVVEERGDRTQVTVTIGERQIVLTAAGDIAGLFGILRDLAPRVTGLAPAQRALLQEVLDTKHRNGDALLAIDNEPQNRGRVRAHDAYNEITRHTLRGPLVRQILPAMAREYGGRFRLDALFARNIAEEPNQGPIIP